MWEGDDGWNRFKKAGMSAVFGYAKAYAENEGVSLDVMMQAHLLEVRCTFEMIVLMLCLPLFNTSLPPCHRP